MELGACNLLVTSAIGLNLDCHVGLPRGLLYFTMSTTVPCYIQQCLICRPSRVQQPQDLSEQGSLCCRAVLRRKVHHQMLRIGCPR